MPRSIIKYTKDLPEIEGRDKYTKPTSYLEKVDGRDEFKVVEGRRSSQALLVNELRKSVDAWREKGYPGASNTSLRLLNFWFEDDHLLGDSLFKFYYCQREAIETVIYLNEVLQNVDIKPLIRKFARVKQTRLGEESGLLFQTTMDGKRQIRRFFDEINKEDIQDLPPENLKRYAIKMATGTGKTLVMAMTIAWSYFNKKFEKGSNLSTNFLILAPNVIVYQRLEKDFAGNRIFYDYPLIPPGWIFDMNVTLRNEGVNPMSDSNLILTNIQQIYESQGKEWKPINAIDALLGNTKSNNYEKSVLESIKELKDLIVINDEAHHLHDEGLIWNKTLMSIHNDLPNGLALWLDLTATPKDQNGTFYPWIVSDYPLAQAVEDRIVKAPIIVHQLDKKDPGDITNENIIQKYGEWIRNAYTRWRDHLVFYSKLGKKPVLFIMCTKSSYADRIGSWLVEDSKFGLKEDEVLIIHTNSNGEITQKDLEVARQASRDIDLPENKIKVIVSVLMLREGWDVKNVTVVLGLRPFTARANILPEQAVGRGLRLINGISPDSTQTLEVIGTDAFEEFVRELEKEGVGIGTYTTAPNPPIWVEPIEEKKKFDISLPITRPFYFHNYKRIEDLKIENMDAILNEEDLSKTLQNILRMEFATTKTTVGEVKLEQVTIPTSNEIISIVTNQTIKEAKLSGQFSKLYPVVKAYLEQKCFGTLVDLNTDKVRQVLSRLDMQLSISKYLSRKIGELLTERKKLEFEEEYFKLSNTPIFSWRRQHTRADKTIFNYVPTFNPFESHFANYLDRCSDVTKFSALAEQFTRFRIDYLSSNGSLKLYYPDFIVVHKNSVQDVNWIIETKGRIYDNVEFKDAAVKTWCEEMSREGGKGKWRYIRVNQSDVPENLLKNLKSFEALLQHLDAN